MTRTTHSTRDTGLVPLAVAERAALEVCDWLKPVAEEVMVVGSIRRRKPAVHDIDIMIRPSPVRGLTGEVDDQATEQAVSARLRGTDWEAGHPGNGVLAIEADGPKLKRFSWAPQRVTTGSPVNSPREYIEVDLYLADSRTWPTLVLIRTGSADHNFKLCRRAAELGLRLKANGDGVLDRFGRPMPIRSEQDIFAALGVPYVEPQDRE